MLGPGQHSAQAQHKKELIAASDFRPLADLGSGSGTREGGDSD